MNGQVKVTRRTLHTIAHSIMVYAQVLEAYINFSLIYTAYHILQLVPIKDLINKDGNPTTTFKMVTGTKPLVLHLRVLFCTYVVQKYTAHIGTNALSTCHQSQKGFRGIFVGIPQHQKGYLVYVNHKRNIVSLYDVVFDNIFSSDLEYTSQPYSE